MPNNKVIHAAPSRRRLMGMGAALALASTMGGCSVFSSQKFEPKAGIWQGRISVYIEEADKPESYIAGFLLKGSNEKGSLEVYNPVGSTIAQLSWNGKTAQLYNGKNTVYAESLGELLAQVFGTPLPTEALFAWLAGDAMQTQGWRVNLARYSQGRIDATRDSPLPVARIKIALSAN